MKKERANSIILVDHNAKMEINTDAIDSYTQERCFIDRRKNST